MSLTDIFTMVKADRYTQDDREEIIKAQKEVEDVVTPTTSTEGKIYHWKSGDYRKEGGKYVKIGNGKGGASNKPNPNGGGAKTGAGKSPDRHAAKSEVIKNMTPTETKPSAPKAPKPSFNQYIDAKRTVGKLEDTFKKQQEEYEIGQRLRANGGGASLNPLYGLKPNDLSKNQDYQKAKGIMSRYLADDSAPRVLTGDCKIRLKK